jgi:tagatose-6-phosphate ketose/aldose isomerase
MVYRGILDVDALAKLLNLSKEEKIERGLLYTPAEIAQQPTTWESTFRIFQQHRTALAEFLAESGCGDSPAARPTVFLIGAGTSDYVGRCLELLLIRLWGLEVVVVPSTSLLTHGEEWLVPNKRYLWISFSRSGDSPEGVAVLERALSTRPEIRHIVVSCNAEGRMTRSVTGKKQALAVTLDDAVNDRSLAMTSSFSNMIVFGQCMAHIHRLDQYEKILRQLVEAGKTFLPHAADAAAALAAEGYERICFIGSGALQGVATESALKVLELSAGKVLTMSESVMGLRHGPMAALDKTTLLVAFLSGDEKVARYEKDLLRELMRKQLVKTQIVVGNRPDLPLDGFAQRYLSPEVELAIPDDCRPPLDILFGQLVGLFFSLHNNLTPDRPSPGGVINRVVQNVRIYS